MTTSLWKGRSRHQLSLDDIVAAQLSPSLPAAEAFVRATLDEMRERRNELVVGEGIYEMANVPPARTGLPFVVWISQRANARHSARVKVSSGPKATEFVASVSITPIQLVAGELSSNDLELIKKWIEINRQVITEFWDGSIEYTEDALARLRPINTEDNA